MEIQLDKSNTPVELNFSRFHDQNLFESQIPRKYKTRVFSQGTHNSKNLRCETLYQYMYVADFEYLNICSFVVLNMELLPEEEGDFHRDYSLYSFKFTQSKVQH